jgi:hypothetical protein
MTTSDRSSLGSAIATFLGVSVALVAILLQLGALNRQASGR